MSTQFDIPEGDKDPNSRRLSCPIHVELLKQVKSVSALKGLHVYEFVTRTLSAACAEALAPAAPSKTKKKE